MNVVLLGAPGAGKGTQAAKMVEEFALPHISTGDIFRKAVGDGTPLGLEAKRYMDAGELVPDEVVIGIVKERLAQPDCAEGFILDGFPRTVPQADALGAGLSSMGTALDAVILVDVEKDALVTRLTARRQCRSCGKIYNVLYDAPTVDGVCDECGGEVYQRDDDSVETVTNRLDVYEKNTQPLIDYYAGLGLLKSIDGARGVDEVFADVAKVMRGEA
ncbi:MAG: adenylate kinase [Coriobacteriia bacterium]|nr:adenylate kinase [Coriobacteriia bacterium]